VFTVNPASRSRGQLATASGSLLASAGSPSLIVTVPRQPCARQVCSTISRSALRSAGRSASSSARSEPVAVAESGMTFGARPACSVPTDTTTACVGSLRLLTICCTASTTWHSTGTGSTASCGYPQWPPTPCTRISNSSVAAFTVPAAAATVPAGTWCCRCAAMTAPGRCAANASDVATSSAPDG
jgi:hypothetical protein